MLFPSFTLIATLFLASTQTTAQTVNAAQSSAISAAISSYTHSLLTGPIATSIALNVYLGGGFAADQLSSIGQDVPNLVPTPTGDLYNFGTHPGVSFTDPVWVTQLPTGVKNDLEALRTSVVLAEASIVRSVLGVSATPVVAAVNSATASALTTGRSGAGSLTTVHGISGALLAGVVAAVLGGSLFL